MLKWVKRLILSLFAINWVKRNLDFFASLDDEEFLLDEEFSHVKLPPLSKGDLELEDIFEVDWEFEPTPIARR